MAIPSIEINMDKACVRCGRKGATPGGLCLSCIANSICEGGDMEVKVIIAEVGPQELMNVHRLLAVESPVSVVIGSPQAVMTVMEEEGAFAEA
jgi:hypothetical protein